MRPELHNVLYVWLFTLYGLSAILFYFLYVDPYFEAGDIFAPRLLADSITYLAICPDVVNWDDWYWLRDAGPCIALHILSHNAALLTLCNVVLLMGTAWAVARSYEVNLNTYLLLLLINPMTYLSLFGPNKEIFGLLSTMSLLVFVRRRSIASLLVTLLLTSVARISILTVVLSFILTIVPILSSVDLNKQNTYRIFIGASLSALVVLSILTYFFGAEIQFEMVGEVAYAEYNSQSTLLSLAMESLSANGLYFATYVGRLLLNLFGALANIGSASIETHGIYYALGVMGSSVIFLVMTLIFFHKRGSLRIETSEGLHISLFVVFYTLMHCATPVIQHRYFFPLYPILVLAMVTRSRGRLIPFGK